MFLHIYYDKENKIVTAKIISKTPPCNSSTSPSRDSTKKSNFFKKFSCRASNKYDVKRKSTSFEVLFINNTIYRLFIRPYYCYLLR